MIKFIFHKILGWKINGYSELPVKCVLIAGPHTHWIDLFLGFAIRNSIGEDIKFIGKKELFIFPLIPPPMGFFLIEAGVVVLAVVEGEDLTGFGRLDVFPL